MSTTPRPKSLALIFLLGAFLTGGALGFTADRAMARKVPPSQNDERAMRDSLAKQLNLSADQRHIIDSIFDWRRSRYRDVMKQYRPALDSARDSARVLMINALDSTQIVAFKALVERNRRAADSATRARESNK